MGVPLVLVSNRCHVLEDPWGDGAIPVRLKDPEGSAQRVVEYARENPVTGVVAVGDPITPVASRVARLLDLPFHPPEAVEACRNKYLARERYRAAGLPVPWFTRFPAAEPPASPQVPYPCVLKPLGLSGSRGVIRANDPREFRAAFERIRALLASPDVRELRDEAAGWIQVERYIPGRELAVEGIVTAGRLRVLAVFDKPDPLEGPYFEETIYVTPSRAGAGVERALVDATERAVAAVGLWHGPVHAEMRVNDDGVWMLDMAARPIGGLCARALRFAAGVTLEELILLHALGEDVSALHREPQASGVMMIPIPREGVLEAVEGLEAARATPGVAGLEITAKLGQKLLPLPEGASYLGFIFAKGEAPHLVEEALRAAHRRLAFRLSAALPVAPATPSPSAARNPAAAPPLRRRSSPPSAS
jgi:biotin carboxylase